MYTFLANFRRSAAAIFLVLILVPTLLVPLERAHATVPVDDLLNNAKEYTLDGIITTLVKVIIRAFRDVIIRAMITGRFGGLSFSTSFTIDMKRLVENEARAFMSELTGLDFCNGAIKIPPESLFAARFAIRTQCSVNNLTGLLNGDEFDPVSYQLSFASERSDLFLTALEEKLNREILAETSFSEDFRAGMGFLSPRGENGKIKTPGRVIGDYLQENVGSVFREGDVADEFNEAIVAIINTAVSIIIQKGLDEI